LANYQILYGVCFALIFIGIRVIYSLVAFVTGAAYLNPVSGSITARVLLAFLPELIVTLAFIGVGFKTRNISSDSKRIDKDGNRHHERGIEV
jgi:hypothetical protein